MIKILKSLKENNSGGVTTYVMIMFGMTFILFMFGFHTIWDTYSSYTAYSYNGSDYTLGNPAVNFGVNILIFLTDFFTNPENYGLAIGGILGFIGLALAGYIFRGSIATILQYLIPIIILGALNIFIFPINSIDSSLLNLEFGGVSATIFLLAFFNLFYILAVIEFVRGNA